MSAEIPDTLRQRLAEVTPRWMQLPGVVGTAIGLCEESLCVKVYLAADSQETRARLPDQLEGARVCVEITGEFRAI